MRHRTQIAYSTLILVVLLGGWEGFSRRYVGKQEVSDAAPSNGSVFFDATGDLKTALAQFSPSGKTRILVLGSSQIAGIKDSDFRNLSMPFVLQRELQNRFGDCEVIDLSAGGQVVTESMLVLLGSSARIQPHVVVMGVSLFGMQGVTARDSIPAAFDTAALAREIASEMPADIPYSVKQELLSFRSQEEKGKKTETIQQKSDRLIASRLSACSTAFANRQLMFDRLIDSPIRRDLVAYVKRNHQGIRVARTYRIEAPYYPSIASIRVVAKWCRKHSAPLFVVVLPYDSAIDPLPYLPQDQDRLLTDLECSSKSEGFQVLDLSHTLSHEYFGLYLDGSPDGLHFRVSGHERVGKEIAEFLAGALRSSSSKTSLVSATQP
jgi:hypothetical protein